MNLINLSAFMSGGLVWQRSGGASPRLRRRLLGDNGMKLGTLILTAAILGALFAPVAAMADPAYPRQDDRRETWRAEDWRGRSWREHEWREHEWREHVGRGWGPAPVYYHRPACWYENRSFRNYWGHWEVRAVRVCR